MVAAALPSHIGKTAVDLRLKLSKKKYFRSSYDASLVMVNKINAVVNQITAI